MTDSAYHDDPEATRALQESAQAKDANLARMQEWGAYNLVKVHGLRDEVEPKIMATGYITVLAAISGKTPEEMVKTLGLRGGKDLISGAVVYQLTRVPTKDEFKVRGYTTLPDGLRLKPGIKADAGGYGPGHGAWQVTLTEGIEATQMAVVHPGKPFEPPLHPRTAALYGRG